MTHARFLELTAALIDVKGWLRETLDAALVYLVLLVTGIALFNALRPLVLS